MGKKREGGSWPRVPRYRAATRLDEKEKKKGKDCFLSERARAERKDERKKWGKKGGGLSPTSRS